MPAKKKQWQVPSKGAQHQDFISVIFNNISKSSVSMRLIHMTELHAFLLVEMILLQEPVEDC